MEDYGSFTGRHTHSNTNRNVHPSVYQSSPLDELDIDILQCLRCDIDHFSGFVVKNVFFCLNAMDEFWRRDVREIGVR